MLSSPNLCGKEPLRLSQRELSMRCLGACSVPKEVLRFPVSRRALSGPWGRVGHLPGGCPHTEELWGPSDEAPGQQEALGSCTKPVVPQTGRERGLRSSTRAVPKQSTSASREGFGGGQQPRLPVGAWRGSMRPPEPRCSEGKPPWLGSGGCATGAGGSSRRPAPSPGPRALTFLPVLSFQLCQPGEPAGARLPGAPLALERLWHGREPLGQPG